MPRLRPASVLAAALIAAPCAFAGVDPRGDGPDWSYADAEGDGAWTSMVLADTNGDGLQDVVIADPIVDAAHRGSDDASRLLVFLGGTTMAATPDVRFDASSDVAASAHGAWGDLDGDGDDDFVTWSPGATAGARDLWVRWGGAGGPGAATALDIQDPYQPIGFGKKLPVGRIRDVNGDGYGDLLLKQDGGPTRLHQSIFSLHLGTATGIERVAAWTASFDYPGLVDTSATIVGDLDADGYREIVVAIVIDTDVGRLSEIHVYRGDATGFHDADWAALALPGLVSSIADVQVLDAGDLDGDSREDVLVALAPHTSGEASRLLSFHGDANYAFRLNDPTTEWRDDTGPDVTLLGVGDFDGDTLPDIALGSPALATGSAATGGVALGLEHDGWFSRRGLLAYLATGDDRGFGALGGVGDTNGDGLADVVIGALGVEGAQVGSAQRFLGFADRDLDHTDDALDCAPLDPAVSPTATEIWYDGLDQDCDGNDADQDLDGATVDDDCDDLDPSRHPGAIEIWYDGIDQDCDLNDGDQDGDGATALVVGGLDCNDRDPLVGPSAAEVKDNGIDEDCDGEDGLSILPAPSCGCSTGAGPSGGLAAAASLWIALSRRRARRTRH